MIETKFKDTEIGKIPEEWEVGKIGNLCSINTGSKNTEDKDDEGKYPFYVRSQKIEHIDTFSYDCEAVLTAGDGVGTGKVFHYVNGKFDVHQRVYVMNDFCQCLYPKYFYWQFSENFYSRVKSMTAKSSVDSVRKGMIADMQIALPPFSEQRRIAKSLSNVDALIAAVEKKIEKKKLIKQGAMQQLLTGKKRLPGFNGKWEIKQLGQIGKFTKGAGISRSESQSGKLPAIRYGEIYTDHNDYIREFKTFISDEVANRSRQIHYGDILFTASGETKEDIGKSVAFVNNYKAFAGGDIIIMSPKEEYDPIYMGYITNCRYVQEQKSSKGQGDAVVHIVTADISSVRIPFAPLSEQRAIASVLSNMDSEITALERKRDKLKEVKQGMMQQLLTGKIRLV